jgi:hypothetical protein
VLVRAAQRALARDFWQKKRAQFEVEEALSSFKQLA